MAARRGDSRASMVMATALGLLCVLAIVLVLHDMATGLHHLGDTMQQAPATTGGQP